MEVISGVFDSFSEFGGGSPATAGWARFGLGNLKLQGSFFRSVTFWDVYK